MLLSETQIRRPKMDDADCDDPPLERKRTITFGDAVGDDGLSARDVEGGEPSENGSSSSEQGKGSSFNDFRAFLYGEKGKISENESSSDDFRDNCEDCVEQPAKKQVSFHGTETTTRQRRKLVDMLVETGALDEFLVCVEDVRKQI